MIKSATAYKAFGEPQKALPLYRRAEQIYKNTLPSADARFGGLYNNMALALVDTAQYAAAEQAYFDALDVMDRVPRGENECAITYVNLAHLYETWGKPDKIGECMQKALSLLQSENLPHDGYYAFVLEKCAPSFGYFGDADTARKLKKKAEEIYARA